jgi:hypothetical protein
MPTRPGAIAAFILLAAVPLRAEQAPVAPVDRVTVALGARPLDCAAVEGAYAALARGGRQPGDVAAVAAGRRSGTACAHDAADRCATALGITSQETLTWLLRHPEASSLESTTGLPRAAPAEGESPALPCGLLPMGRRIIKGLDGMALVLWFRNDTQQWITGHDIVLQVNGSPWRGARGEGFAESVSYVQAGESPIGSPDRLGFDPQSQKWEDVRLSEARTFHLKGEKEEPKGFSVEPGAMLELSIPIALATAPPDPDGMDIQYVSCRLTLR